MVATLRQKCGSDFFVECGCKNAIDVVTHVSVHLTPGFFGFQGRDHIFVYVCDTGVFCTRGDICSLPTGFVSLIQNMIMVGNYGWNGTSKLHCLAPHKVRRALLLTVVRQYGRLFSSHPDRTRTEFPRGEATRLYALPRRCKQASACSGRGPSRSTSAERRSLPRWRSCRAVCGLLRMYTVGRLLPLRP